MRMQLEEIAALGWGAFAAIAISLLMSGIIKGITGIGASIASVPVMAALIDLRVAVLVMLVPSMVSNLHQAARFRQAQPIEGFLLPYCLAVIVGVIVGSHLLVTLPVRILEYLLAVMVVAYVAFRLARPSWQMHRLVARRWAMPSGIIAGVLQGATGIAGPAVIAFLNAMRPDRPQFMLTIALIFCVFAASQMLTLGAMGLFTPEVAGLGAVALMVQIVGMEIGNRLARYVPAVLFDRLILTLLVVIAAKIILGL